MLKVSTTKALITGRYSVKKSEQKLGGSIVDFSGANSSGQLASFPCDIVVLDETDKFPQVVGREANAVSLAEQRVKNSPNPKRIKTSTPSTEDGLIWQEFLKGDQRRYFVPCPHCGKEILFGWSKSFNTFPKLGCEAYVFWDQSAKIGKTWNYEEVESSAHLLCPFCNGKIYDRHKPGMLAKGRWVPTNKTAEERRVWIENAWGGTVIGINPGESLSPYISQRPSVVTQEYWEFLLKKISAGIGYSDLLIFPRSVQGTIVRANLETTAARLRAEYEISRSEVTKHVYTE